MAISVHRAWLAGAEPKRLGVVRGGAFFNSERLTRCASRDYNDLGYRFDYVGFRCVVSPF